MIQEKLFEKLGVELDEETKFKSVDEVIDYLQELVEENSKPQYASEELAKLDEYVRNGGDLKKYFDTTGGTTYTKEDLSNINIQKAVVREDLKNKGYSEARIAKTIERYEDSGILDEEAEDALESINEYKEKTKEKLLKEQEEYNAQLKEQKRLYIKGVEDTITKMDSVRGVAISKAEKAKLMDYIFKVDSDGMTAYQKDYAKSHKNLIEAAYFTMKGDSFVQQVQQKANSEAARRLKEKLADKGKRVKDQTDQDNASKFWSLASGQLRKPF